MTDDHSQHRPHTPDAARVEALAGYGLSVGEIALVLDLEEAHVAESYRKALAAGRVKANTRVAENLFRKATGEGREAVTAAIFWLKTRARWKETSVTELCGPDGGPVAKVERIILAPLQPLPHQEHDASLTTGASDGAEPTFTDGTYEDER